MMKIEPTENKKQLIANFFGGEPPLSVDYNYIMPVIRKINSLGKGVQFAIFKTYVSCTVEKGGKFFKDFSFSHAEYITPEQTDLEAAYKLVVKFVEWFNKNKIEE